MLIFCSASMCCDAGVDCSSYCPSDLPLMQHWWQELLQHWWQEWCGLEWWDVVRWSIQVSLYVKVTEKRNCAGFAKLSNPRMNLRLIYRNPSSNPTELAIRTIVNIMCQFVCVGIYRPYVVTWIQPRPQQQKGVSPAQIWTLLLAKWIAIAWDRRT